MLEKALPLNLSLLLVFAVLYPASQHRSKWQCHHQLLEMVLQMGGPCVVIWWRKNVEKHSSGSSDLSKNI